MPKPLSFYCIRKKKTSPVSFSNSNRSCFVCELMRMNVDSGWMALSLKGVTPFLMCSIRKDATDWLHMPQRKHVIAFMLSAC